MRHLWPAETVALAACDDRGGGQLEYGKEQQQWGQTCFRAIPRRW